MFRRFRLRLLATAGLTLAVAAIAVLGISGAQAGAAPAPPGSTVSDVIPGSSSATPSSTPSSPVPSISASIPNTSPFPPNPPTNVSATRVTSTSVTLSWTASTQGCCSVTGYDVTYNRAFDDVVYTASFGNVTTATIPNLQPTGQYSFHVTAHDDLGHRSNWSDAVVVVTPATDTASDLTPPSAPTGLTASDVTATTARLSWSPSTDNVAVTGYNVYQFDGLFVSTLLTTTTATSTTVALTTNRYQYYVRARDAAGNLSLVSNTVVLTGSSPSPSPSANPPGCRVRYAVTSQWYNGFVASVTVTNTGTGPISPWTLAFSFGGGQRIQYSWNASHTQTGAAVTLTNLSYDATIAPGASVTVGLQGSFTTSATAPTAFTLNGSACTAG